MKALVLGLGSMGKRRVRCLRENGIEHIHGFDAKPERAAAVCREYGIPPVDKVDSAVIGTYDLVIISTPPDQHHQYLEWCAKAACSCFVEASVVKEPLMAIAQIAARNGGVVAPSCTLRFHSAIRDIAQLVKSKKYGKVCNFSYHCGQYLPDWHPWEKVTDYYVSNPLTGGAREIVPFELTWMVDVFGWPQRAIGNVRRTADVGAAIDDTYAVLLDFQDFVGTMVVDVVARHATRKLLLNLERATVSWDWNENIVKVYEADEGRFIQFHQPSVSAHAGYNRNIGESMYVQEMAAFVQAHLKRAPFPNTLDDDIRVLSLLEDIENFSSAQR